MPRPDRTEANVNKEHLRPQPTPYARRTTSLTPAKKHSHAPRTDAAAGRAKAPSAASKRREAPASAASSSQGSAARSGWRAPSPPDRVASVVGPSGGGPPGGAPTAADAEAAVAAANRPRRLASVDLAVDGLDLGRQARAPEHVRATAAERRRVRPRLERRRAPLRRGRVGRRGRRDRGRGRVERRGVVALNTGDPPGFLFYPGLDLYAWAAPRTGKDTAVEVLV